MQGAGGRRAWPGSGSPGAPRGRPAGGPSSWAPTAPPAFVLLPPVPQASGSRLGRQQLSSPVGSALPNPTTPPTIPNIAPRYRQSRGDMSLFAPVDRRVIAQAAGSSLRRQDSGGFRVGTEGAPTRHNSQTTLRSPAARVEQRGVAALHGSSSASATRMARHTAGPSSERLPSNTVGRSQPGSGSHSRTRHTAENLFDEVFDAFGPMSFMDDQVAGSGLARLPTLEEMEERMRRSSENSFSGGSALPYTSVRGPPSTRGFPFVSALQRPGSGATNHRSHSHEPRSRVSVIDERYLWSGGGARPRRSREGSSDFLRTPGRSEGTSLFDSVFGESLGARIHRGVAANMVRSFLSSLAGPLELPWRGPWEVRVGLSLPTGLRAEHQRHFRRVIGGRRPPFVLFAAASADPANFDLFEHNLGWFLDEIECSFALDDLDDLEAPLMLVVSGGDAGDGDDFVPQIWADANGTRVTLQQLSEARCLRDNLGQHTFKWTFGKAEQGHGHSTTAHGVNAPAGTGGGRSQQTQRGRTLDASTDAATEDSDAGAQTETHNGYDCCICLSAFEPGDVLLTLRCLHIFHERCIDRWIMTSHSVKCPLCSTKIAESPSNDQVDA
ncbi:zinc finger (C3HC4 RING finger) protein, putative [Eimeria mitis]|uniref:RING-type E3 ubiquitin transferase n=1 Tax=Eimeria mitis TaxID=44415 RepID=U6KMI6_9EIME|nr:zinc finger (C3HC4 RING finger) protein, putative [Eimeria mitis]CDJ36668.1 zinc finger (C3HC4 RING finger) protein, putative [Eimeria mitis]